MEKINYEVYMKDNGKFVEQFESWFPYSINQDIFTKIDGKETRLSIRTITHNHLGEKPVTRLNCVHKKIQ